MQTQPQISTQAIESRELIKGNKSGIEVRQSSTKKLIQRNVTEGNC